MTTTPLKGTISMRHVNMHARLILDTCPTPELRKVRIASLRFMNDTDRARIKVRIEQILADR